MLLFPEPNLSTPSNKKPKAGRNSGTSLLSGVEAM
jgi:hypothetical protein